VLTDKIEKIGQRLKIVTDQRYREFYLQRQVTDVERREQKADKVAARLPTAPTPGENGLAGQLDTHGYAMLTDLKELFTPALVRDMRGYLATQPCADPYRKELPAFIGPENAPKETHVAFFSNETIVKTPHAFRVANHPAIIDAVSHVLGSKPTVGYMTAWWSVPAADGTAQHAEKFHRDVDDWRFIKLFLYLTDVDETAGPHMYVPGSHKINTLTEIRRYTDEEVAWAFGQEKLKRFTGAAGTAFLENTYGFHRGVPPTRKPRLIFQVLYSLRPVIYGPKEPVARIGEGGVPADIDPYINRIYCAPAAR
jgi:hypothetical protein